ncbi:MAG: (d)CMP kinase [Anaerolineaceae bacterium]|nr:(d)CMP kinase [Anaerolineaceae bacterium]
MVDFPSIITIDGPAASGKSTLAEKLARHLGYLYFDTGVMYRAVTLAAMQKLTSVEDEEQVTALAEQVKIDVQPPSKDDGRKYDVLLDGVDVTWEIRTPELEAWVSQVSAYVGVRKAMTDQQRRIGRRGAVVMVGRDIGTVVFPEAGFKLYLDASVEERARRRTQELCQRGGEAFLEEILASMRRRDAIDSTRTVAPLKPAPDAVILCTDGIAIDQLVEQVLSLLYQPRTNS